MNEQDLQSPKPNLLKFKHIDYIELYVGNTIQSAHFYQTAFGFTPIAYAGLETRIRDRSSVVMKQGNIHLVLTAAFAADSVIAEYVKQHGDSVRDIVFAVNDAAHAFQVAIQAGAHPIMSPTILEDDNGQVIKATIAAYGDTVHSFVERRHYNGVFLPGYCPTEPSLPIVSAGLVDIDHVAVGMEPGKLDEWVAFYENVLSFHEMHEEMVTTEHTSMNSKVVTNSTGNIKFPLVEPIPAKRKSQIEEFLNYHDGSGAQHIAFSSNDIIYTIQQLRTNGVHCLHTPDTYYDMLEQRVGALDASTLNALRELKILVDRDEWGTLMQIFTKPVHHRPTMFLEVIQRNGAKGFGAGNIKALFEAVEREQALRGNI